MDLSNIEPTIGAAVVNLAESLSSLVLKGTATVVHGKIESIKNERNVDTVRMTYNEIVNQLLQEREEAVRIAQTYKQELDCVVINDDDIEYLQNTISKVLDILQRMKPSENEGELQKKLQALQGLKELISKDVLKTMQLLGFNYKEAIGQPLTEICANAIKSSANRLTSNNTRKR